MVGGPPLAAGKPTLSLRLDATTRMALKRAAKSAADAPADLLGGGIGSSGAALFAVGGTGFEAIEEASLEIDFVICSERLSKLKGDQLTTLQDNLQGLFTDSIEAASASLPFSRFEQFAPDRSVLVARFRIPEALTVLRKEVWRELRAAGVAYPDGMWMPHVKLGRIKGLHRGQLEKLDISGLNHFAPNELAQPTVLALRGAAPKGSPEGFWQEALAFAAVASGSPLPQALSSSARAPARDSAFASCPTLAPAPPTSSSSSSAPVPSPRNPQPAPMLAPVLAPALAPVLAPVLTVIPPSAASMQVVPWPTSLHPSPTLSACVAPLAPVAAAAVPVPPAAPRPPSSGSGAPRRPPPRGLAAGTFIAAPPPAPKLGGGFGGVSVAVA
mmetsp:Transcript_163396/g.523915  ORF Transcript_163396/g.523915 Transcript_163396/m.523915 type:complete len:385 (-) Transcript_163396:121-1275(-)